MPHSYNLFGFPNTHCGEAYWSTLLSWYLERSREQKQVMSCHRLTLLFCPHCRKQGHSIQCPVRIDFFGTQSTYNFFSEAPKTSPLPILAFPCSLLDFCILSPLSELICSLLIHQLIMVKLFRRFHKENTTGETWQLLINSWVDALLYGVISIVSRPWGFTKSPLQSHALVCLLSPDDRR